MSSSNLLGSETCLDVSNIIFWPGHGGWSSANSDKNIIFYFVSFKSTCL